MTQDGAGTRETIESRGRPEPSGTAQAVRAGDPR